MSTKKDMSAQDLTVGFVSTQDARDPKAWSGTLNFMANALEARVGYVHHLGPFPTMARRLRRKLDKIQGMITGQQGAVGRVWFDARRSGRLLSARLEKTPCDVLFAPVSSTIVADYKGPVPVVYSSDATIRLMTNYYPEFRAMSPRAHAAALGTEAAALGRSDLLLMPTDWSAQSVLQDYGVPEDRVSILPYGCNLTDIPPKAEVLAERPDGPLRVLFVGLNWQRKGGDLLLQTIAQLQSDGIDVHVDLVGGSPWQPLSVQGVQHHGFLDKARPEDLKRLYALYASADLMVVPTRQEAYGIVFVEAAAFGLPSVATLTGGVGTVVRDGVSGALLPSEAGAAEWAAAVRSVIVPRPGGHGARQDLREGARHLYESELNWDAWGDAAVAQIMTLLDR